MQHAMMWCDAITMLVHEAGMHISQIKVRHQTMPRRTMIARWHYEKLNAHDHWCLFSLQEHTKFSKGKHDYCASLILRWSRKIFWTAMCACMHLAVYAIIKEKEKRESWAKHVEIDTDQ